MVHSHAPQSRRPNQGSTSRWTGVLEQASVSRALRSKRSMALASACSMALLLPTTLAGSSKAQGTQPAQVPLVPAPSERAGSSFSSDSLGKSAAVPAGRAGISTGVAVTSSPPLSPLPSQLSPLPSNRESSQPVVAPSSPVPVMRLTVIVAGHTRTGEVAVKPQLTVGQALAALGVAVAVLDHVTPNVKALAYNGLSIRVQQVKARVATKHIAVPAQLLYRPTTAIGAGRTQQIQAPRQGRVEITERVWTLDGRETRREFVSKRLALAPQPRIIALGARSNVMPGNIRPHKRYARAQGYINSYRGGSPRDRFGAAPGAMQSSDVSTLRPIRCLENVVATGYSAGVAGGGLSNWTATGVRCTYGAVAVDPRVIPLGSKLYIEGYGYGFACDTGGAIKGKHIDLAFDSPGAAMNHGKTRVRVWVLGR